MILKGHLKRPMSVTGFLLREWTIQKSLSSN